MLFAKTGKAARDSSSATLAKKIPTQETWLNPLGVCFHNSRTDRLAVLSLHTLRRLPEFIRFFLVMQEFSTHYAAYKQHCLTLPQKAALESDSYLADLFAKPVAQFIREKKYAQVAADYISKFTYACIGVGTDNIISAARNGVHPRL